MRGITACCLPRRRKRYAAAVRFGSSFPFSSFPFRAAAAAGALFVGGACAFACGPKPDTVTPVSVGPGDGGAQSASTLPSGLPPYAPMPEPGVKGSAKVTLRPTDAACLSDANKSDVKARLDALAGCDKGLAAKTPPFEGNASEADPAVETTFRAEKGHCYRVLAVHDLGSLVVVLNDSAGARIAESASGATPEHARACFTEADTVTVRVAGGRGKGRFAVAVVQD
jgi:hypothetical protein